MLKRRKAWCNPYFAFKVVIHARGTKPHQQVHLNIVYIDTWRSEIGL